MTKQETRTVTFLLSGSGAVPVGGFKVAYEYANGLADRGWNVRVVHPRVSSADEIESLRSSVLLRTRRWLGYQRSRLTGNYRPDSWFQVNSKVELLCTRTLEAAVSSAIGCLGRNFLGYGDMGEHAARRQALLDSTFGDLVRARASGHVDLEASLA